MIKQSLHCTTDNIYQKQLLRTYTYIITLTMIGKIFMALVLLVFQSIHGFLLDKGNSSFEVKPVYLTAAEYFQDKMELEQKMVSHGQLNLLVSQIQNKLDAFEQKILTQTSTSTGQSSISELELKYQALAKQFSTLEQTNRVLEQSLATKEQEIIELRQNLTLEMSTVQNLTLEMSTVQNLTLEMSTVQNLTLEMSTVQNLTLEMSTVQKLTQDMAQLQNITQDVTKFQMQIAYIGNQTANILQQIRDLEQLKSIAQLQTLHNIEQTTQNLADKVSLLESTEQARGQDFVALYHKFNALEMDEKITSMKLENITKQQMAALEELENRTQTDLDLNQRFQNESLYHLQQYVNYQFQPVILTACHGYKLVEQNSALTFPDIITSVGVTDLANFQQTGKFRCSIPGYYYVTMTTQASEDLTIMSIMLNSDNIHLQRVTGKTDGYITSGMEGLTLHLTTGDEVWIWHTSPKRYIYTSCFSIFKIK